MPPSAMTGTPKRAAALAQCQIAESWGMPAPEMMRVVQIEPAPTPTLTSVGPGSDQGFHALRRHDVAGYHEDRGSRGLDPPQCFEDSPGMAMGGVDHEDVDVLGDEKPDPRFQIGPHPHGGGDAEASRLVQGRVGIVGLLGYVLYGDESLEPPLVVGEGELFDPVLLEDVPGLFEGRADGGGD